MWNIKQIEEKDFTLTFYRFSDEITKDKDRTPTDIELRMLAEIDEMGRAITILKRFIKARENEIKHLRKSSADDHHHIARLTKKLEEAERELKVIKQGGDRKVEEKTPKKRSSQSLQWLYSASSDEVYSSV